MSEYQCYGFVALDRRLTAAEMAELRGISTRAAVDVDALRAYLPGGPATLTTTGEFAVLDDLCSEADEPEEE